MSRKTRCLIFGANVLGPRFAHILGLTCRVFLLPVSVTHRCAHLRLPVVKHDTSTPLEHRNQNRISRVFEKTVGAGLSRDSVAIPPTRKCRSKLAVPDPSQRRRLVDDKYLPTVRNIRTCAHSSASRQARHLTSVRSPKSKSNLTGVGIKVGTDRRAVRNTGNRLYRHLNSVKSPESKRTSRVFEKNVGAGFLQSSIVSLIAHRATWEACNKRRMESPRFEHLPYNQTAERGRSCPTHFHLI